MRTDIQALRGYAVLLVLLYHAQVRWVQAGYLGVDVFFVISGYLITRLVSRQVEANAFSFVDFYSRRMRRLLPAAYTTFLVTALAAVWLLNATELIDFSRQLMGGLTFSANYVLWNQTGYFAAGSEAKPLLHIWSLAIEEQYYLLLPALLFFIPRKLWSLGAWAVLALSAALYFYFLPRSPEGAFYAMPTRAWELAIGSVGALTLDRFRWQGSSLAQSLYWLSLSVLLAVPLLPSGALPWGVNSLPVCAATLVVVLARKESLTAGTAGRVLGWFGDISYSLYLVHWPLYAFLHNVWIGPEPRRVRYTLILVSILLGYLQYRFVESPLRRSGLRLNLRTAAAVVACSLLVASIPLIETHRRKSPVDYAYARRANVGMGPPCAYPGAFSPQPMCQTSSQPSLLIWGDSFAMQFVPGILRDRGSVEIVQATRSSCGPLLGLAYYWRVLSDHLTPRSALSCAEFNNSVARYISATKSIRTVVLAASLASYLWDRLFLFEDGKPAQQPDIETVLKHLKRTVDVVRNAGKRVVLIAPPPGASFNVGGCTERLATGRIRLGPYADCEIPLAGYQKRQGPMHELLERVPREAGVDVIRLEPFLCPSGVCRTMLDNRSLYRDDWHLSYTGSELLVAKSGLVRKILETAR